MSETFIDYAMFPTDERDRILGQFLDSWGRIEQALSELVRALLGTDFQAARVVFANAGSVASVRELLLALGELRLSGAEQAALEKALDPVKAAATKRNRIVHGSWMATMDSSDPSGIKFGGWVRRYNPASPSTFIATITREDPKITANFTFSTERIRDLSDGHDAIVQKLNVLFHTISARVARQAQQEESAQPPPSLEASAPTG